jgi:DNA-binding transcriptional MerR regulator
VELHPADAALAAALTDPSPNGEQDGLLTIDELAERAGLSVAVLEAVEREGLLVPRVPGDRARYAPSDVEVIRAGMQLLEAGLPLGELLDLARRTDDALRGVADHAVDVFLRFVRDPIRGTASDDDEATRRLLEAFERMLPAAGDLVGSHMRRLVVAAARARLEQELDGEASSPS